MLWRFAARVLTGPVAFLVAGVIDIATFAFATLKHSIRRRAARKGATRTAGPRRITATHSCEERE